MTTEAAAARPVVKLSPSSRYGAPDDGGRDVHCKGYSNRYGLCARFLFRAAYAYLWYTCPKCHHRQLIDIPPGKV